MSVGSSLFLICPSVQSLHSMRNSSPGLTHHHRDVRVPAVVAGQLLLDDGLASRSTLNSVLGIVVSSLGVWSSQIDSSSDRQQASDASRRPRSRRLSWMIRPRSSTSTRSAIASAKLSTCSDTTMVSPARRGSASGSAASSLMIDGWMPSVGSSSSSTRGLLASARAMTSCCCCPPDRLPPRAASHLLQHREELVELLGDRARGRERRPVLMFSSTVSVGKIMRPCGT